MKSVVSGREELLKWKVEGRNCLLHRYIKVEDRYVICIPDQGQDSFGYAYQNQVRIVLDTGNLLRWTSGDGFAAVASLMYMFCKYYIYGYEHV